MAVPPRHLRFDDNTVLGLRNADFEGWKGALGSLADLPPIDGPAGAELAALKRTLATWGAIEPLVTRRERHAARFWMPGRMALAALLAAVVFAAAGAWLRWLWLFKLAPPALAVGIILAGANWIARRVLDRRRRLETLREEAVAILERLAGRTFLAVAGSTVIEGRGYRTTFRKLDESAEAAVRTAGEKVREVDATLNYIRAANQRLGRSAEDRETQSLAALRQRMQSELRGLQIARAELNGRRARLDARFEELGAVAEREALSHRARALLDSGEALNPAERLELESGLADLQRQVDALQTVLTGARTRVEASVEQSTTTMGELLSRTA